MSHLQSLRESLTHPDKEERISLRGKCKPSTQEQLIAAEQRAQWINQFLAQWNTEGLEEKECTSTKKLSEVFLKVYRQSCASVLKGFSRLTGSEEIKISPEMAYEIMEDLQDLSGLMKEWHRGKLSIQGIKKAGKSIPYRNKKELGFL